ncbi:MAG: hypothetical protein NTX79_00600 [Candidatus Micrarchaeota archaeon]|nr:hypothetical protein [Candidatus Micrarchaeota archaeon]
MAMILAMALSPLAAFCNDSDGGVNIFARGTATGTMCGSNATVSRTDFCTGRNLTEYLCAQSMNGSGSCISSLNAVCVFSCSNGACASQGGSSNSTSKMAAPAMAPGQASDTLSSMADTSGNMYAEVMNTLGIYMPGAIRYNYTNVTNKTTARPAGAAISTNTTNKTTARPAGAAISTNTTNRTAAKPSALPAYNSTNNTNRSTMRPAGAAISTNTTNRTAAKHNTNRSTMRPAGAAISTNTTNKTTARPDGAAISTNTTNRTAPATTKIVAITPAITAVQQTTTAPPAASETKPVAITPPIAVLPGAVGTKPVSATTASTGTKPVPTATAPGTSVENPSPSTATAKTTITDKQASDIVNSMADTSGNMYAKLMNIIGIYVQGAK